MESGNQEQTNGLSLGNNGPVTSIQYDHYEENKQMFLQAFEKPTQIYRYLRTRHSISPIFLHRNLSYMKNRMSRSKCIKKDFEIDKIMERVLNERKLNENKMSDLSNLVIHISGIQNRALDSKSTVAVTVSLLKMNTKNKNDSSSLTQSNETIIGKCFLNNNSSNSANDNSRKITLLKENFISNAKHTLVFKVTYDKQTSNNVMNGNQLTNGVHHHLTEFNDELSSNKRRRLSINNSNEDNSELYHRAELVILGNNNQECLLKDGEYHLKLNEYHLKLNNDCEFENVQEKFKRIVCWDNVSKIHSSTTSLKDFAHEPVLVFHLEWSADLTNDIGYRKQIKLSNAYLTSKNNQQTTQPLKQIDPPNNTDNNHNKQSSSTHSKNSKKICNNSTLHLNGCTTNGSVTNGSITNGLKTGCLTNLLSKGSTNGQLVNGSLLQQPTPQTNNSTKVIYRFIYNKYIVQQTKASSDFQCPWCGLNCLEMLPLKHHLVFYHSRFNFLVVLENRGYKIDVTINESYDGSYCGNPHQDMSNFSSRTTGPVQRTPVTLLFINLRGKRLKYTHEIDNEQVIDIIREQYGHDRLYYHSGTCQPIQPHEFDVDSEDERNPEWMRIKTQLMIDDFTDVNEGEKEVMKLWNLHMMKYPFVGWVHIPLACELFIRENWQEIIRRNIYMNFILHLNNLFDYQLLSSETLRNLIKLFHEIKSKCSKGKMKQPSNQSNQKMILSKRKETF